MKRVFNFCGQSSGPLSSRAKMGVTILSFLFSCSLSARAAETVIAYDVPAGVTGNQNLAGGAVGMDFEVANEIIVTRLGVFDDGSDGILDPSTTLVARLWDRGQDPAV